MCLLNLNGCMRQMCAIIQGNQTLTWETTLAKIQFRRCQERAPVIEHNLLITPKGRENKPRQTVHKAQLEENPHPCPLRAKLFCPPLGSKILSFWEDPCSLGLWCAGKKNRKSQILSPLQKMPEKLPGITKTCLYNVEPLKPHFYSETGVYRGILYFSNFRSKT